MDHFYFHFLPFFRCEVVSFYDLVEDLSHHFSRLFAQSLMSSARIPLPSGDLPDLSLQIAACISSDVISGILSSSLSSCSELFFFTVFVKSLVELSKGIGDSFARSDAFTFCILDFRDEDSLLC